MTGKDARRQDNSVAIRRTRMGWAFSVIAVATICIVANRFWTIGTAEAQNPNLKAAPAGNGANNSVRQASATNPASAPVSNSGQTNAGNGSGTQQTSPTTSTAAPVGNAAKPTANGQPAMPPELKVVAMVNREQITRQDLARECLRRYGKDVLESMVNKHLILQACKKNNIVITDEDVTEEINRIATKFNLTVDRWMQLLSQERNVKPTEYRRDIIWPTLALRRLAADKIQVTPEERRKAMETEYGPKVKARLISVSTKKKAEEVLAKLKAQPDQFEMIAKDHSEDPSAAVMGLIPPIRKHLGDPKLEEVAFSLKKDEISPVVQVHNQYVILKCEAQMAGVLLGGDNLKRAESILDDRIRDQKIRTVSSDLFKRLQDEAKVVKVLGNPELEKQNPGIATMINGHPVMIAQVADECILRHGSVVLDGEVNRQILTQELKRRNTVVTEKDISMEVARAADANGYNKKDGTPDIDKWLQQVTENDGVTVELYVQDAVWPTVALKKLVGNSVQVTEEDIQKGYEANYGERVEVLAIVVGSQRQAQTVWEQARSLKSEQQFGELASQYSVEPQSRANFGKVPPVRRHGGQPLLEDHAFKLKAGELSPIISMGDKYIILRCLGRTKPVVEELSSDIRDAIVKDVLEKKMRGAMTKEFDRLKETAEVDNFMDPSKSQTGRRVASKTDGSMMGPVGKTPGNAPPALVRWDRIHRSQAQSLHDRRLPPNDNTMNDPLFSVADQVALVSGGSRGIGRAIAEGFAQRGASVVISGREEKTLSQTAAEIIRQHGLAATAVQTVVCDVAKPKEIQPLVDNVLARFGRIDTLVNVAGVNRRKPALEVTEDDYDFVIDINLKGAFLLSQAVGRAMVSRGSGCQVNISSLNADRPLKNVLPYAVSKAGITQMTRALALEWGPSGVRVNGIAPGFVLTDLTQKLWSDPTMQAWGNANTPQRRLGVPADMIGTAIFLASAASSFMTGQTLFVDGGFTAGWAWPIPG